MKAYKISGDVQFLSSYVGSMWDSHANNSSDLEVLVFYICDKLM